MIRDQLTQIEVDRVPVGEVQAGTSRVQNIQIAGVNIDLRDETIQGRSRDVNVGTVALANGRLRSVRVLSPTFAVGPGCYRAAGRLNLDGGQFDEISSAQSSGDLRITTPVGPFGVDFGYLLDPPEFLIPQASGPPAIFRRKPFQTHIRFGQAF